MSTPIPYGQLDRLSRRRYGISGDVLLQKLEQGESGGSGSAKSGAGARGWFQFMPGTRQAVLNYTGGKIDPWRSEQEARDAAVLHLTGKLGNARGLSGYNPGGGKQYVDYILNQKVGAAPSYTAPSSVGSPSALPGPTPASGLIQTLQRPTGSVSAPAAPAFSAKVQQPAGYTPPPGVQANPQPDLRQQLAEHLQADAPPPYQPASAPTADPSPAAGGLPKSNPLYNVRGLFQKAAAIDAEHLPYRWGGGHGPTPAKPGMPLDCSGAVSRLFGVSPRVSGQFESFGQPGQGKNVTIYASGKHVLVEIAGRFWGTSATNPGGGAGWIPRSAISQSYLKNFVARHPAGM